MIVDQAQRLRERAREAGVYTGAPRVRPAVQRARVIAVTSGKGGVGKSMVSSNLAIALARYRKRVLIVDADFGLANIDVMMNVYSRYNLSHVVAGKADITECVVDGPGGIRLISGGSGLTGMANLTARQRALLLEQLKKLEETVDVIIIDTGAGISHTVLSMVLAADEAIVVTTPEPTAITDAYAMIKVVAGRKPEARLKLLVNMAADKAEAERIGEKMCAVSRQFLNVYVERIGYVPADPQVSRSIREKKPFVLTAPNVRITRCIQEVAAGLCRDVRTASESGRGAQIGFFHTLSSFFNGG